MRRRGRRSSAENANKHDRACGTHSLMHKLASGAGSPRATPALRPRTWRMSTWRMSTWRMSTWHMSTWHLSTWHLSTWRINWRGAVAVAGFVLLWELLVRFGGGGFAGIPTLAEV